MPAWFIRRGDDPLTGSPFRTIVPAAKRQEARQRHQQRGLAGAVRAEDGEDLLGFEGEGDVAGHGQLSVADVETLALEDRAVARRRRHPDGASLATVSLTIATTRWCVTPRYAVDTCSVRPDLLRGPGRDQRAEVEDVDRVAQVQHEAHVVVDQQDRDAGVAHLPQPLGQPEALGAVEPGRRFVEQEESGLTGQGTGHRDELALALGEHRDLQVAHLDEAEARRGSSSGPPGRGRLAMCCPTWTFSSTVRSSATPASWNVRASPSAARRCGE